MGMKFVTMAQLKIFNKNSFDMKVRCLMIILILLPAYFSAQNHIPSDTLPEPATRDTVSRLLIIDNPGLLPYNPDKKLSVRMEMGTSFSVGSGSAGLFGVYAAPHISYKVSPKLRVNFGTVIQNTNFINYYNPYNTFAPEYTQTFGSSITRTLVYAEGQYLVNPRLMVNAKVYKEISTFGTPQVNPHALDLDGEGVSVGFQYKVNENMHIGAQFGYSKGRNPYNPYYPAGTGRSPFASPYGIDHNDVFDKNPGW